MNRQQKIQRIIQQIKETPRLTLIKEFSKGLIIAFIIFATISYADRQLHTCTISVTNVLGYTTTTTNWTIQETQRWLDENTPKNPFAPQLASHVNITCNYDLRRWRCLIPRTC